jgi:hypothetical protein
MKRRELLRGIAALAPASSVLGHYSALAAPLRKKVKITDLKVMVVGKPGGNTLVRIDTDAGISGYGEAYWGFGVKDVMLGYLRGTVIGQDPLDIDPLYTQMILRTGGAGAIGGVTVTAISGVEIALWDLAGKLLGTPVCKLLWGPVPYGCAGLPYHQSSGFSGSSVLPRVGGHGQVASLWFPGGKDRHPPCCRPLRPDPGGRPLQQQADVSS